MAGWFVSERSTCRPRRWRPSAVRIAAQARGQELRPHVAGLDHGHGHESVVLEKIEGKTGIKQRTQGFRRQREGHREREIEVRDDRNRVALEEMQHREFKHSRTAGESKAIRRRWEFDAAHFVHEICDTLHL